MNAWTRKTLLGIFFASLLAGSLSACSSASHHRGPMFPEPMAEMREKMVNRITSKLNLDGPQQLKLQALANALQSQRAALVGSQAMDPRAQIQALVSGETFDSASAQTLIDEKMRAVQSHSPAVVAAMADFYNSLGPVQQQQVRDVMQRRRAWFQRG
ncbi:Spy/CpxP family protein refolding chaperone [Acidovorax sp. CCYZU-2555]|uniref:Spy/CpxP family protein refolding chaperone n=1 Tax=Acidovorax sp. CCYZU-2555 TaxID=2835042 RepID=UPI001BCB945A|nr:Spy/CpxP family protein refolding chaperone [Acidovorax sp. CCYZU-2555]MBS7776840.1 Spy/CpxP family protein refolding chaperone [Acidovorax sp. CCYZU-2555]